MFDNFPIKILMVNLLLRLLSVQRPSDKSLSCLSRKKSENKFSRQVQTKSLLSDRQLSWKNPDRSRPDDDDSDDNDDAAKKQPSGSLKNMER